MFLRSGSDLNMKSPITPAPEHTRGCLQVPQNAKVYQCEPEIVVKISSDTFLFENPPYGFSSAYKKIDEKRLEQKSIYKFTAGHRVLIKNKLKKGTQVLVRVCNVFNPVINENNNNKLKKMKPFSLKVIFVI